MKFVSTRDDNTAGAKSLFSLEEALCAGYAPDGGLFVPNELPKYGKSSSSLLLKEFSKLSTYKELLCAVLEPFVSPEIPPTDFAIICEYALTNFETPETIPIVELPKDSTNIKVVVAELFHGPTYCFKDFGLRVVVGMLAYFAEQKHKKITLVAATTGDTGPAAVRAVQDLSTAQKSNLGIAVHFPKGQISEFQRRQLTTVQSRNVRIVAFEGSGDDMDVPIKNIMTKSSKSSSGDDNDGKERIICGINSYNIGRPLVQMVHFIWIYLRVVEQLGIEPGSEDFKLDLVLPTGAMGNLTGAYMAKQLLGLPLGKLCAGVNVNDFTNVMFATGRIEKDRGEMKQTLSEAINIQLPYNLERILYYLTKQNHAQIKEWYTALEQNKEDEGDGAVVEIGAEWLGKLQEEFCAAKVTDDELCDTIRNILRDFNYCADPHTGVALCAAEKLGYEILPSKKDDATNTKSTSTKAVAAVAIIATASPCKFQEAMTTALGESKWDNYKETQFPKSGLYTMEKVEIPPIAYVFDKSKTLAENQKDWERRLEDIIVNEL